MPERALVPAPVVTACQYDPDTERRTIVQSRERREVALNSYVQPEQVEPMRFRAQQSKAEGIETRRPGMQLASHLAQLLLQL